MDQKKAVAISKDVLKQLRLKRLNVETGAYIHGKLPKTYKIKPEDDAQKHLKTIQKHCEVCAKGSLVLSYVGLYDNMTCADLGLDDVYGEGKWISGSPSYWLEIEEIFGIANWNSIEAAFEGDYYDSKAYSYMEKWPEDHEKRLRAILQNVIKNNGVFKPENVMKKKKKQPA